MDAQEGTDVLKVRVWNSIPVRLGLGVLLLTLLAAGLVLVPVSRQETRRVIAQDVDHARKMSTIIAANLASHMLSSGGYEVWAGASVVATRFAGAIDASRILVLTKAGVVKAGSESVSVGQRMVMKANPDCPGCESSREEDFPASVILSTPQGAHYLRVVNPVPVSLACLQCHAGVEQASSYVLIDFDLTPVERANKRRQATVLGMGLAASLALVTLIVFLFRRMVMRPANSLIAAMRQLAGGDLSARTPELARDELGQVARHFNHMAAQIADQIARIDSARTESALLYTLVVEASKKLETTEFAAGVARVIFDKLHTRHTAFFLETADNRWICATAEGGQAEAMTKGETDLETALLSGSGQIRQLLDGGGLKFFMDACRSQKLQLARETGELTLALPVIAQARLVGLLACIGIGTSMRMDENLFSNLGAHLTLAAVNSRNYTGAITDGLTGLRNKQYGLIRLDEAVSAARRYQSPLALAMCDIDHFKRVNDTYGHPAGDAVLKEVSHRIAACVRKADIAVRYGGEEFMLILPQADANALAVIGEKIRQAVAAAPIELGAAGGTLVLTLSVGIAAFDIDTDDGESLIARADRMLYRAKEGGRNRVELEV